MNRQYRAGLLVSNFHVRIEVIRFDQGHGRDAPICLLLCSLGKSVIPTGFFDLTVCLCNKNAARSSLLSSD